MSGVPTADAAPEVSDFNERAFYVDPSTDVCKCIEAEKQLAVRLRWTNLFDAGGTLIGTPPDGARHSRGQAVVPAWTRKWDACGPLMVQIGLYPIDGADHGTAYIWVFKDLKCLAQVKAAEHPSKEAAVRFAIVSAAITAL
jgi:hypothetical protein